MTDDWDRRCLMNVLNDFYCPEVLVTDHLYSESGVHRQIDPDNDHSVSMVWARLGIKPRFPDFRPGVLTTTPPHTSSYRIGHFSQIYKQVSESHDRAYIMRYDLLGSAFEVHV